MRIFVAGPYSGTVEEAHTNVRAAMAEATELMHRGHEPFVPHLSHYWHLQMVDEGAPCSYERWMRWTCAWLRQCEALFFLGSSPGADRERALAEELGLPIYTSLKEVPNAR